MNKKQLTALQAMENAHVHFHLNQPLNTKLTVWFSSNGNGSHIADQDNLKAYLEEHGFFEFDRGFDRQCGKGIQTFNILGRKKKAA